MKLYNIFLGIILLLGVMALAAYEAGPGGGRNEQIADRYIFAGISMLMDGEEENVKEDPKEDSTYTEELFYADEWVRGWFIRLDKNGDQKINQDEFVNNIDLFDISPNDLTIFEKDQLNPDGELSLLEFNNFVDTTTFLDKEAQSSQHAAPLGDGDEDFDILKLIGGVICISLVIAAFKLV